MTGNREWPVRRARSMTSAAESSRRTTTSRSRSVITSTAVSSVNSIELVSRVAVDSSRVPTSAERRTSAASSCGERPPDSSSRGSTPTLRSRALALPLNDDDERAQRAGEAALQRGDHAGRGQRPADREVLGDELADDHREAVDQDDREHRRDDAADRLTEHRRPRAGRRSSRTTAGCVVYPSRMVVRVMPSWAPESSVDSRRSALRTDWLRRSSGAAWPSTRPGSRVTSENSLATNTAVPSVSSTPRPTRSHSVSTRRCPSQDGATTNADPEVGAGGDPRRE